MLKAGLDSVPHTSRPVNNNLYPFEKPDNAHFLGRSGSESEMMISKSEPLNQADDHFPFVDSCLPHVKAFSYVWFHLQAAKRQYFKKCERKMPLEEELKLKNKLQSELQETKQRWATRLLAKLRKDIDSGDREKLAQCLAESSRHSTASSQTEGRPLPCVLSIADLKGKMRRIDCLRQADKVWRLDIVLAVLFRAVPLESTDGERVEKSLSCRQPLLCVNPYHLNVGVRELDMFLSNYLFNFEIPVSFLNAPKANQAQFVAVTDGVYSRCVFGARELLELSQMPINSDGRPFPSNASTSASASGVANAKQQPSGKAHSAFKPLMPGASSGRDLDQIDCDKDDGASDEEVASLVAYQNNVSAQQRVGQPVRQAQPGQQQGSANRQQQGLYPAAPAPYNNNANRVVVVPSQGLPVGSGGHNSFQPIRTSPPISTTSVANFIKQELQEDQEKEWARNGGHQRQVANGSGYSGATFSSNANLTQQQPRLKPNEIGSDSRLEDFANYVVEAASRSNSPVRKQPRMSLDALVSNSGDFDLGASNGQGPGTTASTPFQPQPLLSGISSPSLMMQAGMMMINGMQAAAAAASNNAPVAPPPPPTHPLLYSPNPFSLFSSPAITPRTTPRSTPVPNPQSTIAAAVAAAAAQFGGDPTESADRDRQLQLAAGLFEQNLRVFGLLSAGTNTSASLFRGPGFSGLGGLTSGFGSALMSGADTGNAGQTTPLTHRSPTREIMVSDPVVNTNVPNPPLNGSASNSNDGELATSQARPAGNGNYSDSMWNNSGVETPQIDSSGSGNGQPNLSTSNSNSGDDSFAPNVSSAPNQPQPQAQQPAENTESDAKNAVRCKPSLVVASSNIAEEKV